MKTTAQGMPQQGSVSICGLCLNGASLIRLVYPIHSTLSLVYWPGLAGFRRRGEDDDKHPLDLWGTCVCSNPGGKCFRRAIKLGNMAGECRKKPVESEYALEPKKFSRRFGGFVSRYWENWCGLAYVAGSTRPKCNATIPNVMRSNCTLAKPAARILSASSSAPGNFRTDSGR